MCIFISLLSEKFIFPVLAAIWLDAHIVTVESLLSSRYQSILLVTNLALASGFDRHWGIATNQMAPFFFLSVC